MHRHAAPFRLVEREGNDRLGIFTPLKQRGIAGWIGIFGEDLLVRLQFARGVRRPSGALIKLAEPVVGRGMLRLELDPVSNSWMASSRCPNVPGPGRVEIQRGHGEIIFWDC